MPSTHINKGLEFKAAPPTMDNREVEITIAPNAGACFGVVRAIKLGYQAAASASSKKTKAYTFGPLIHNPLVVSELTEKGVVAIDSPEQATEGTVVLRSHGVPQQTEAQLKAKGLKVVDATCPLVKKPQRIAQSLGEKGYYLVVVGDAKHPEIKGVVSYFGRPDFLVTYSPADIDKIPSDIKKVGILAQTTIEAKVFDAVADKVKERFSDVLTYNTICDATSIRQTEAVALAQTADVLVVVGGKNSSNTNKLVKLCKELQPDTHHIEDVSELSADWFRGKAKIGVTAGASTPHEYVDLVGESIARLIHGLVEA